MLYFKCMGVIWDTFCLYVNCSHWSNLGGGENEIERVCQFYSLTALWVERAYISAVFGLWKELSKMSLQIPSNNLYK